jgi:alpha-beta hydrolase superfamily lysophospholipase
MEIGMQELKLNTTAGNCLNVYRWARPKARGAFLLSHGWSEHAGRYRHLAGWLNAQGYEVWAPDHQGHGKSSGKRGHARQWSDYASDLEQVRIALDHEHCFLFGHSMGGMIGVLHLLLYPGRFQAAALSGPAMDVSISVPQAKALVSRLLDRVWPSLSLANPVDPSVVCSDPQVVRDYMADPYNHGRVSVRWFEDYQRTIGLVKERAAEIRTPIGIWHGGEDILVAPWTSRQFFDRLTMPGRHYEVLSGARHEILNEPGWQNTARAMLDWLERHADRTALAS